MTIQEYYKEEDKFLKLPCGEIKFNVDNEIKICKCHLFPSFPEETSEVYFIITKMENDKFVLKVVNDDQKFVVFHRMVLGDTFKMKPESDIKIAGEVTISNHNGFVNIIKNDEVFGFTLYGGDTYLSIPLSKGDTYILCHGDEVRMKQDNDAYSEPLISVFFYRHIPKDDSVYWPDSDSDSWNDF